ncbi:hypothetical protein [Gracilimonas tropica]|uniref:hypothetical protein n=1 Tax=Gracilimonas tropica TaxID=454600 RepID=UPI0003702CAA|nr:hypothetical protein [Gracilimonas tropica]
MDEKFYEIFRAGSYPQRNVSEEDIQAIANNYDPDLCEAPISIFHYGDGYAYGWIKELKAEGDRLMASFKDVTDELKEYVAKKMLKRHSIELYEDLEGKGLYLKGLAMLGKDTPAVKGMEPISFKEESAVEYSFEEDPSFANDFAVAHFKAKADAAEQEKSRLETELTQEKTKTQTYADKTKQMEFETRKSSFESFLDTKVEAGKLEPKFREKAVALFKHLDKVDQEDEKANALETFKEMLTGLKDQLKFGEEFTDGDSEEGLTPHQLAEKITAYQEKMKKEGKIVSYSEALNHVKNENKDTK